MGNPDFDIINKYFPNLTDLQKEQFKQIGAQYKEWNSKINVVSRKDIDLIYEHHILHSLAIAKVIDFKAGTKILDLGTGGGFPGVPLAIMFPDSHFTLCDSIRKKVLVVEEVSKALNLQNINPICERVEKINDRFDFVVSRAVAPMGELIELTKGKFLKLNQNTLANGWLCLKGGNLAEELGMTGRKAQIFSLNSMFEEHFFETKKVVYIRR